MNEWSQSVKATGMFAKEDQPLLGVCRTANLPMLEILVLLVADIARWRGADSIRPIFGFYRLD